MVNSGLEAQMDRDETDVAKIGGKEVRERVSDQSGVALDRMSHISVWTCKEKVIASFILFPIKDAALITASKIS